MSAFLFVIGIIVLIASTVFGAMSWGFIGVFIGLAIGIISSATFFGLAVVLSKQDDILIMLNSRDMPRKRLADKITCARCKKEYEADCSNCPHCAFRPTT